MSDLLTLLKVGADVKLSKEQAQYLADLIEQQQQRISELERQNSLMRVIVNCVKPDPKNQNGVSIEGADGYVWLHVVRELNKPPKEQDDE